MRNIVIYLLLLLLFKLPLLGQKTEHHLINFNTVDRSMWRDNDAFQLDIDKSFYLQWNENSKTYGRIKDFDLGKIDLGSWGAELSAGTSGKIGHRYFIKDVT